MTITLGGVTATTAEIAQTLARRPVRRAREPDEVLPEGHPARRDGLPKVSKEEIALFPEIRVVPGTKQNHVAQVRPACIHAMKRVLSEPGWHDALVPPPELSVHGPGGGGRGLDTISVRRTAKQNYGEDQAKMWAEKEFPGALVQKGRECGSEAGLRRAGNPRRRVRGTH
jgi:hypothetical protein